MLTPVDTRSSVMLMIVQHEVALYIPVVLILLQYTYSTMRILALLFLHMKVYIHCAANHMSEILQN